MKKFTFLLISLMLLCTMQTEAQTTVTIGNDESSSSTRGPFQRSSTGSSSVYSRANLVYLEGELAAAGILPGSTITQIEFDKKKTGDLTASGDAFLKVYMRTTAAIEATAQNWSDLIIGSTLVGDITFNLANNFPEAQGYMSFPINPYVYNGGTLEIAVDWDSSNLTPADLGEPNRYFDTDNGSITWRWSGTTHVSTATRAGSSGPPSNLGITGGDLRAERCDIRITYLDPAPPPPPGTGVSLWIEDFDGSNATNPFDFSVCSTINSNDYYGIVCENGGPCGGAADIDSDIEYIGDDNSFFGARDIIGDNDAGDPCQFTESPVTSSATGIDISSCSDPDGIYLCFDIAESDTSTNPPGSDRDQTSSGDDTWDGEQGDPNRNCFVTFSASIDGGIEYDVASFGAPGGSNSGGALDSNCDGIGDGTLITSTFTTFCFKLASSGNALDLSLTVAGFNTQGEDVAIDNIEVFCGIPPSGPVYPFCSPAAFGAIFYEDFDGSNVSNPFDFAASGCVIDDSNDYYGIVCEKDGPCGSSGDIDGGIEYIGDQGSFFGARDIEGDPCGTISPITSSATGIDISSCAGSRGFLCFDIAESDPSTNPPGSDRDNFSSGSYDGWDDDTFVTFSGSVNGGAPFNIASFASVGSSNNLAAALDTDCDGTGDGAVMTSTFTTYCFELSQVGNTLDLSLTIAGLTTQGEDVAIDNITVFCSDDAANLPAALSTSCTAPLVFGVPTLGEWAVFILFLLILNMAAVFIFAMQNKLAFATENQTVSMINMMRSLPFNKSGFMQAMKHAFGVALVGFAIIYMGWGEIVPGDFIGMAISIPLVAYFIHLVFAKK